MTQWDRWTRDSVDRAIRTAGEEMAAAFEQALDLGTDLTAIKSAAGYQAVDRAIRTAGEEMAAAFEQALDLGTDLTAIKTAAAGRRDAVDDVSVSRRALHRKLDAVAESVSPSGPRTRLNWRASSASAHSVEVAWHHGAVYVRDAKEPSGPCLSFTPSEWIAFLVGVVLGEFNIPSLRADWQSEDV